MKKKNTDQSPVFLTINNIPLKDTINIHNSYVTTKEVENCYFETIIIDLGKIKGKGGKEEKNKEKEKLSFSVFFIDQG